MAATGGATQSPPSRAAAPAAKKAAPWARFLPKPSGGAVGLDVGATSFKIVELTKQGAQQTLERVVVSLSFVPRRTCAAY